MTERLAVWLVVLGILGAMAGFSLGIAGLGTPLVVGAMFYGGLAASIVGVIKLCLK